MATKTGLCLLFLVLSLVTLYGAEGNEQDYWGVVGNTLCRPYSTSNWASSISEAEQKCSEDNDCYMFFDNCNNGDDFRYCSVNAAIDGSSCGSILYKPVDEGNDCHCKSSWTWTRPSGIECANTQNGCTNCDGDSRGNWCKVVNPGCTTDEGLGWSFCDGGESKIEKRSKRSTRQCLPFGASCILDSQCCWPYECEGIFGFNRHCTYDDWLKVTEEDVTPICKWKTSIRKTTLDWNISKAWLCIWLLSSWFKHI